MLYPVGGQAAYIESSLITLVGNAMNTLQLLGYGALFWFISFLSAYFLIGMFGKPNQSATINIFKEFSAAYVVVLAVVLFAAPKTDELRQLLWSSSFPMASLSVILVLFYSIATILRRDPEPLDVARASQRDHTYLMFRDVKGGSRFLSINIEDLDRVMKATKKLVAEVRPKETVLDALCRVQDVYENGHFDLLIVNTTGSGLALRDLLFQHFPETPIVGALPVQHKTSPDFELLINRFA